MKRWLLGVGLVLLGGGGVTAATGKKAAVPTAAERGREALLGRCFSPPMVSVKAYHDAWKRWGVASKPADYDRLFRERYGLWPTPYPNDGLPMGLRQADGLFGKGLSNDCLLCHAGSVAGQVVLGLGNASLDMQTLSEDLSAVYGGKSLLPFPAANERGTIEAEAAVIYLMQFRNADLGLRLPVKMAYRNNLCQDIPAWWLLKKKKTMFHTGGIDVRSIRANMPFLLSPLNSAAYIKKQEPVFRDIRAFILSLAAPKYPFPVDEHKAAHGQKVFVQHCAKCHGTYGPRGTYPNKVIGLDVIGTDRTLAEGYPVQSWEQYKQSWFNQEKGPDGKSYWLDSAPGYQAPPLDGIWATAPYFHNGSVPTVYHVLNSRARPKIHTRSFRTGKEDYDPVKLGWKITVLNRPADPKLPPSERRKVYDTTLPGRGNGGHPFGDKLTEAERLAVIEYLKTL